MLEVSFKFVPNQKVKTILEEEGIVETCVYIGKGAPNRYNIMFKGGKFVYFDEDQLEAVEG
jgi:hypothetical protein